MTRFDSDWGRLSSGMGRAYPQAFTERLETAIARYHANAITTAQVLEDLIRLAKDIRAAQARGEGNGPQC
jgi:hypothetical protein